ncbi:MAG: hypothetical protein BA870_03830 [Desulfuromonadales bacterium C00003094]|nr:MAG: hypothetical protein BA870_03830 [Desulfuromonadales bacterium C00003094]OEU77756.1 MAG: hypothetical protein BA869_03290 [Desulfuromonadales bacterium C00003107]
MAVFFVKRDQGGAIVAISRQQFSDDWEELQENAPELTAFSETFATGQKGLASTDLGLVRVLEDTIDLLIERGVLRFTDFPEDAQVKLLERRSMRASLRSLDLLKEEGEEEII